MKKLVTLLSLIWLVAATAEARDLEDILKEKKVIDPIEANEAKAAKEREQAAAEKAAQSLPSLPSWLKMVTLFGDVRIRNEDFFRKGDTDRNRDRFRLRFGARVDPTDELQFGFKLTSGDPNNPLTNNETFTGEFTGKHINVGNAYVKLMPSHSIGLDRPWLTLMGGKYDVPLYKIPSMSGLVFDPDLTPEGFFESLKPIEEKEGFLRGLSLNMGQWIIEENTKTGEAAIYSFQGVAKFALGDVLWNIGAGDYKYVDPSSIAVARNTNNQLAITNNVTLSDGTSLGGRKVDPTTVGPTKNGLDANGKPITIKKFVSGFNNVDVGTDILIPTGAQAWPVRTFFEYVVNTDAANGNDKGLQVGAGVGATADPGNISLTYAYERLETDAVVSAFSDDDFGRDGGTNTKGHIVTLTYTFTKNLMFKSTAWFDKPIKNAAGRNPNADYRWQVDLIASF